MFVKLFNFKNKIKFLSLVLLSCVSFSFNSYGAYFEKFTAPPRADKVLKNEAKKFAHSSLKAYRVNANKLTPEETRAVQGYSATDGTYKLFNEYYRDPVLFNKKHGDSYVGTKRFTEILKGQVDTFRSGIVKLPRYNGKVYRGTQLQDKLFSELNVGDLVYEPGFMSTSILPEVAKGFSTDTNVTSGFTKALFEIDLTQGGYAMAGFSKVPGEAEVLVQPKTYMRVKAIASQGDTKLIALENVTSLREEQYAYNLYSAEREPIGVAFEPSALHLACAL
ncbi:ADP-ribosyltransferase [Vibrio cholerae]|uniref:ADP-ribosyltransferase n=1 Tax=Vibrio cholerae TaxID=666 RepID=UPI000BA90FF6|nr:ADP-ribosyltransferase [Vibrio cholerae]PAR94157.1 hypothetical protein CGT82_09465 [Vibrio cholerae]